MHQDWFDENDVYIQALLEEKHHIHRTLLNDSASSSKKAALSNSGRTVPRELHQMQYPLMSEKAEKIPFLC